MTERTLVQAAQSGLPEATDELIERYYPRVYSFVASLKGADAEDITQEVFARALGALPRFNGEYQFGAWLLQIARNVCIDETRRQVRRPQPTDPIDLVELETTAQPDHVWESVSAQIAVTTVHKALNRLPKRQRTVLVLRELEGMSYADIAISLRISTRAVEISLSRARKRMRAELASLDLAEEELAECRRMANVLAADPAAVSREDVAAHMRTCRLCQAMSRRRSPGQSLHALGVLLMATPTHLAALLRRPVLAGARIAHSVVASPATATMSPLSRLAEVGASVVVATAVSASAFSAAPATAPAATAPPAAVPIVAAAAPVAVPVGAPQASASVPLGGSSASAQPSTASGGLPVLGGLSCMLNRALQPAAGGAPQSGDLLSELLSPLNSLSPVLNCDPTLSQVDTTLKSLTTPAGTKPPAAAPPASAPPTSTQPSLLPALQQLLQSLLGQPSPGH